LVLALFVTLGLFDAAFYLPRTLRKNWLSLIALAGFAVVLATAAVAWVGVAIIGSPLAAAVALGAIVAPP
jgi:CPA1 family monovalent cation:H+ antiporter